MEELTSNLLYGIMVNALALWLSARYPQDLRKQLGMFLLIGVLIAIVGHISRGMSGPRISTIDTANQPDFTVLLVVLTVGILLLLIMYNIRPDMSLYTSSTLLMTIIQRTTFGLFWGIVFSAIIGMQLSVFFGIASLYDVVTGDISFIEGIIKCVAFITIGVVSVYLSNSAWKYRLDFYQDDAVAFVTEYIALFLLFMVIGATTFALLYGLISFGFSYRDFLRFILTFVSFVSPCILGWVHLIIYWNGRIKNA